MYHTTTLTYIIISRVPTLIGNVCVVAWRVYSQSAVSLRSQSPQEVVVYNNTNNILLLYDECVPDLTWHTSDSNHTTRMTDATEYRVYSRSIYQTHHRYCRRRIIVIDECGCGCAANGPLWTTQYFILTGIVVISYYYYRRRALRYFSVDILVGNR